MLLGPGEQQERRIAQQDRHHGQVSPGRGVARQPGPFHRTGHGQGDRAGEQPGQDDLARGQSLQPDLDEQETRAPGNCQGTVLGSHRSR